MLDIWLQVARVSQRAKLTSSKTRRLPQYTNRAQVATARMREVRRDPFSILFTADMKI
jgi:hypothetical protein